MVDREHSLGQGFEPSDPGRKMSRSDKLLVGSASTALVVGPLSPTIGGVAVSVGVVTGAYKIGRFVYRRYIRKETVR